MKFHICDVIAELERSQEVAEQLEGRMKAAEQERRELEEARRVAEEARIAAEEAANLEKEERERKVGWQTHAY